MRAGLAAIVALVQRWKVLFRMGRVFRVISSQPHIYIVMGPPQVQYRFRRRRELSVALVVPHSRHEMSRALLTREEVFNIPKDRRQDSIRTQRVRIHPTLHTVDESTNRHAVEDFP